MNYNTILDPLREAGLPCFNGQFHGPWQKVDPTYSPYDVHRMYMLIKADNSNPTYPRGSEDGVSRLMMYSAYDEETPWQELDFQYSPTNVRECSATREPDNIVHVVYTKLTPYTICANKFMMDSLSGGDWGTEYASTIAPTVPNLGIFATYRATDGKLIILYGNISSGSYTACYYTTYDVFSHTWSAATLVSTGGTNYAYPMGICIDSDDRTHFIFVEASTASGAYQFCHRALDSSDTLAVLQGTGIYTRTGGTSYCGFSGAPVIFKETSDTDYTIYVPYAKYNSGDGKHYPAMIKGYTANSDTPVWTNEDVSTSYQVDKGTLRFRSFFLCVESPVGSAVSNLALYFADTEASADPWHGENSLWISRRLSGIWQNIPAHVWTPNYPTNTLDDTISSISAASLLESGLYAFIQRGNPGCDYNYGNWTGSIFIPTADEVAAVSSAFAW